MKSLLRIITLFFPSLLFASGLPTTAKWQCEKQITGSINELKITLRDSWTKNSLEETSFRIPTTKVGHWLVIEKGSEEDKLIYVTPSKKTSYIYEPGTCKVRLEMAAIKSASRKIASEQWFDDEALSKLLKDRPNSVLFIWSPYMSLSLKSVPELEEAAKENGLPISYVMDPMAGEVEALAALKKHKLPEDAMRRVDSMEMSMRNALIHYPTLFVIKDGKICKKVQRGYRTSDKFRAIIANIYGGCK